MVYRFRMMYIWALCVALWLAQPTIYALANAESFVKIVDVTTRQFPTVAVTITGGRLPNNLANLPIELWENQQAQTLLADHTEQVGLQLALVIDAKNMTTLGQSGEPHYAEITSATLALIKQSIVIRHKDRLAAYAVGAQGGLATLQDWTDEPNLVFNSIVQKKPDNVTGDTALSEGVLRVLAQFPALDARPLARSLVIFSAGSDFPALDQVVEKAAALQVQLQVIELAGPGQAVPVNNALQQLAARTHGQYLFLQTLAPPDQLWTPLTETRTQRILTYQSSATTAAQVEVHLRLPNGSSIVDSATMSALKSGQAVTKTAASAAVTSTAVLSDPVAAAAASGHAQASAQTAQTAGLVGIPGLPIFLPRGTVIVTLALLFVVLAYLVYAELADRRKRAVDNAAQLNPGLPEPFAEASPASHNAMPVSHDDAFLERGSPGRGNPLVRKNMPLFSKVYPDGANGSQSSANGAYANDLALVSNGYHADDAYGIDSYADGDDADESLDEDGLTVTPVAEIDDDATYWPGGEVKLPRLGCLVRETDDPSLPAELPIYGIKHATNEVRHIHIGRHSKQSTIVIKNKHVSRVHATIVQKGSELYLRDQASTAGTFVNWQRLAPDQERLLNNNDHLSFGIITYSFQAANPAEPSNF